MGNRTEQISRRDFLIGAGAAAVLFTAPWLVKNVPKWAGFSGPEPEQDTDHPMTAESLPVNDICPFRPAVVAFTPVEHISNTTLPLDRRLSFFGEKEVPLALGNDESFLPRVNHAAATDIPTLLNNSLMVFGFDLLAIENGFKGVVIAEDVNPITDGRMPRKVVAATGERTVLAVSYDASGIPADYDTTTQVPEGHLLTEFYDLTYIAKYLVNNSLEALDVNESDCGAVQVDQVFLIGTQCAVARININGRFGFFAFDLKARKPVDIVDVAQIYELSNRNFPPSDITDFDFVKFGGVVMSIKGRNTIVDVENGLVATEKHFFTVNHNTRSFFTFGFVPEHILKIDYEGPLVDIGPIEQPSTLRLLPVLNLDTVRGEQLEAAYPNAWDPKKTSIVPLAEVVCREESPASTKPPSLIFRPLYLVKVSEQGFTKGQRHKEVLSATVSEVNLFGGENKIVATSTASHWPIRVGDQYSGLVPEMAADGGKFRVKIGPKVALPIGEIPLDRLRLVNTPHFKPEDDIGDRLLAMELMGNLNK